MDARAQGVVFLALVSDPHLDEVRCEHVPPTFGISHSFSIAAPSDIVR